MTYRRSARVEDPWPFRRSRAGRVLCLARSALTLGVLGHDWVIMRGHRRRSVVLAEFHPLAGVDAQCRRCGLTWEDASDGCPGLLVTGFRCQLGRGHEGACDGV